MIDRWAFEEARGALERVGFVLVGSEPRPAVFLDGPDGKVCQALRLWFSGDELSPNTEPLPSMVRSLPTWPYRVIALPTLVRMKLSAHRTIDRVHLQDMVRVGLLDANWVGQLPEVLADRLRHILVNPDG